MSSSRRSAELALRASLYSDADPCSLLPTLASPCRSSVAHELAAEPVNFHRALLRTDLKNSLVLANRVNQYPAFMDVCGERLFGVHIESRDHGADAGERAGVVRRRDDDRIEFFAVKH